MSKRVALTAEERGGASSLSINGTKMVLKDYSPPRKRRMAQRDRNAVIYCLEGVWRHVDDQTDRRSHDGSVEPLLQYLKQNDYWDFRHRNVATIAELRYFLDNEWVLCSEGSIPYFATHGAPGSITLGTGQDVYMTSSLYKNRDVCSCESADLVSLLSSVSQEHCHIHFCGCSVLAQSGNWIDEFIKNTKFSVVSGYTADNLGWTDVALPAVLADVMLFSQLSGVNYSDGRSFEPRLKKTQKSMDCRFKDCGFSYKTRTRL